MSEPIGAGTVVWLTGASSGIGRAAAVEMARRGATIAVTARSAGDMDDLARACAELPGTVHPFVGDVTEADAMAALVASVWQRFGRIDVAVLNAGTHQPLMAQDFAVAPIRKLVEVNLMGTAHCLAALLPPMLARDAGRIAVVSSVAGYRGLPTSAIYGATKAALTNITEAIRLDLHATGLVVQVVHPGFVKTPLTDRNPFPMPFLMDADKAARRLVDGLGSSRFEIVFPRRFVWLMKIARLLPYRLYFALMKRTVPKRPLPDSGQST